MTWVPYLSPISEAQVAGLRGRARKAYETFKADLEVRGCAALDYRLTGEPPINEMCCKHLYGKDRAIVTFVEPDEAWILLVAQHDEKSDLNVYRLLYMLAGVEPPSGRRSKPACCDSSPSDPPLLSADVIDNLVRRTKSLMLKR